MSQLIDIQRRFVEIGRLRYGEKVVTKSGGSRPSKLDTWRLTSASKEALKAAAEKYGGSVVAWEGQWEVITESASLDVMLPPQAGVRSYSLSYELWSGGGCQRRCDGENAMVAKGDALVPMACQCDPDERECKPTLRVPFFLPDLPGLGVWRLDTGGYNAAAELPGMLDLLAQFADAGRPIQALLRLEQRTSKKAGQTRKFAVPVLDLPYSLAELTGGALAQLQTNGAAGPEQAQLTSSPRPAGGAEPEIPTTQPARAPAPVLPLDQPLTGDELQRWLAGTHAAIRARVAPGTDEHTALREVAGNVVELGERSLNDLTLSEWRIVATALREMPLHSTSAPGHGADDASVAGSSPPGAGPVADNPPGVERNSPIGGDLPSAMTPQADTSAEEATTLVFAAAVDHGLVSGEDDIAAWTAIDALALTAYPERDPESLTADEWLALCERIQKGDFDKPRPRARPVKAPAVVTP